MPQPHAESDKALRYAKRLLRIRPRSCREMGDRLRLKGFSQQTAIEVVQRLVDSGALDDRAFARWLAESELARKPTGRRLLTQKLYRKRLARSTVEEAVNNAIAGTNPVTDARSLAQRKLRTTVFDRADVPTRRRRIWSLLARRGFDRDTIDAALQGLPELQNAAEPEY